MDEQVISFTQRFYLDPRRDCLSPSVNGTPLDRPFNYHAALHTVHWLFGVKSCSNVHIVCTYTRETLVAWPSSCWFAVGHTSVAVVAESVSIFMVTEAAFSGILWVTIWRNHQQVTQGSHRLHFARTVHSRHPLPADRRCGLSSTSRRRTELRT